MKINAIISEKLVHIYKIKYRYTKQGISDIGGPFKGGKIKRMLPNAYKLDM